MQQLAHQWLVSGAKVSSPCKCREDIGGGYLTIIYNKKYVDIVPAGKRCYLFTGLFGRIELSQQLKKIEILKASGEHSRIARLGDLFKGLLTAGLNTTTEYRELECVLYLKNRDKVRLYTNDRLILAFLSNYLEDKNYVRSKK